MKPLLLKILSLFICLMVGQQCLDAQTPSITAGQTAGMMVTEYNPAQFIIDPWPDTAYINIDLNHDGVTDVVVSYYFFEEGVQGLTETFALSTPNVKIQFASVVDTVEHSCIDSLALAGFDSIYYVSQLFYQANVINNGGIIWHDSAVIAYSTQGSHGCGWSIGTQLSANFYFAGRLFGNNDTSLFYIHIGTDFSGNTNLYDYAIQGPDTTFMLTSIPVLQNDNDLVKVFPVPALNALHIQVSGQPQFEINNVLGEKVKEGKLVSGDNQLDLADLSPGVYFVTVIGSNGRTVKKIIKE